MKFTVALALYMSVATITSAQPPTVIQLGFRPIDYRIDESSERVVIAIVASQAFSAEANVSVQTEDMTALDGTDYVGGTFTVTFPVNETEVSFSINIINDVEPPKEEDETFRVNFLTVPSGASSGEFATVTIQDDCRQECQNGGTLDNSTCECICPANYTGLLCQDMAIRCNDTVIGDPLYEVPVIIDGDSNKISLCFEVHGEANEIFNLISDTCVSVNAFYSSMNDPVDGNIISKIGVRAKDSSEVCQNIEADLEGCTARVNGSNVTSYNQDGIHVMWRTNRIRISVPNCESIPLVMWVICEVREQQPMIKLVVARGFNLRPTSHGLIGQFWNVKVEAERYNVTAEDKLPPNRDHYAVTVTAPEDTRRFLAEKAARTWDDKAMTCLYCGHTQGGNQYGIEGLSGSVIEGAYDEYIVIGGLFATDYKYSKFMTTC